MAEMVCAFAGLAVADADDMAHCKVARLPVGQKALFDLCEWRLWHRMAAAGSADQHGEPGLNQFGGVSGGNHFHGAPDGRD